MSLPPSGSVVSIQNVVQASYLTASGSMPVPSATLATVSATSLTVTSLWYLRWTAVSGGYQATFQNLGTGTYLTACIGCGGQSPYGVNVQGTTVNGNTQWVLQPWQGNLVFENMLANEFLFPSSATMVALTENSSSTSIQWFVQAVVLPTPLYPTPTPLVPIPGPTPSPLFPPLTPLVPPTPIPPQPSPLYPPLTPLVPPGPAPPVPFYPPLTPLVPIPPSPTPLFPPLTPLVPPSPAPPSPSPLFPPLTPLNPPSPNPPAPTPLNPPLTPLIPIGPLPTPLNPPISPLINPNKSHPMWALWTGLGLLVIGVISVAIGLKTGKVGFTLAGSGILLLSIISLIAFLAV